MRSKWPKPQIPDNSYRKLKCQGLQTTKLGHGGTSEKQHHVFVAGTRWPKEGILGCQKKPEISRDKY